MIRARLPLHDERVLRVYCGYDSLATATAWPGILEDATEFGVTQHFHERTMPLSREVLRMQARGLPFYKPNSEALAADMLVEQTKIERSARRLMGPMFRLTAPSDLVNYLHGPKRAGCLALPVHRRTEQKQDPAADEETLLWYRVKCIELSHTQGVKVLDCVLAHRELRDLRTEYVVNIWKKIDTDGRVRSRLLIHVVPTTRLASRDPNHQNQPKRCNPVWAKRIRGQYALDGLAPLKSRSVVVGPESDPGPILQVHDALLWQVWVKDHWELWEQDLQGAEKRISYLCSGDTLGIQRLEEYDRLVKAGKHEQAKQFEVHRCNALDMFGPFGLTFEMITPHLRDFIKNGSYMEAYGGRAETADIPTDLLEFLQKLSGKPGRDVVHAGVDSYRKLHHEETAYRETVAQTVRSTRELRDPEYGTVRIFFGHMKDDVKRGLNDFCQRGVAKVMNDGLRAMRDERWKPMKSERALRDLMDSYIVRPRQWSPTVRAAIPTEWKRSREDWGHLEEWA